MAKGLAEHSPGEVVNLQCRSFPDGETYLRFESPVEGRRVAIVCTLDRPDGKFLPLAYAARTATELGAESVGLVAPYLAYMRQDRRFQAGEALTSDIFASLISREFDWLVTVEPHLHRRKSLSEIYGIPKSAVEATPLLAAWIAENVEDPLLIGPDEESEQWVGDVAKSIGAPFCVARKERKGDREVSITLPELHGFENHTPVLIDDMISTGRTMIETVNQLKRSGTRDCVCAGVHAVFAPRAYQDLLRTGARIVTTNTIAHPSNAIDVTNGIAVEAARRMDLHR